VTLHEFLKKSPAILPFVRFFYKTAPSHVTLTLREKAAMNEEVLDWKEAMTRVLNKRELYSRLLGKFIDSEQDSGARIAQALSTGETEKARALVHTTKGAAANLGAKALAAAALEMEMAIKASADTTSAMARINSALTDTLVAMQAFRAQ
jgi:two-component system sensor histidine kinase/response regulator